MSNATVVSGKPKPFLDFSTPEESQRAYLVLFGLFIIFPAACTGFLLSGIYISPGFAIAGGIGAVMFSGGVLGFFTVIIRQAVQQVNIKVIEQ